MRRRVGSGVVWLALAGPGVLAGGCEVKYTEPPAALRQPGPAGPEFEAVWEAARQTLRAYHFRLDRQDRRAGVITTLPMTGQHFFEFWRKDAVRPADYVESTVQTIYRTASVTIRPVEDAPGRYAASVEVRLRRADRGTPQVTSTSEAYSLFGAGRGSRVRRRLTEASDWSRLAEDRFVELGNDRSLEARLTEEIAALAERLRAGGAAGGATTRPGR